MISELLKNFKCMVVENGTKGSLNFSYLTKGIVLDFQPSAKQAQAIQEYIRDNNVKTLFTVAEVNNSTFSELITKQIVHYALTYMTGGLIDIPREIDTNSDAMTVTFIRGVTMEELQALVDDSLYSNRPVKDSIVLADIIKFYELAYRVNDIKNNELRVLLFNSFKDRFTNGDDAVRYIVNIYAEADLLIKSKEVIAKVQLNAHKISQSFVENHLEVLATVFNRHKRILLAAKLGSPSREFKSLFNKIARLSKKKHIPIVFPMSKSFVADISKGTYDYANLESFSLRDKFKILNLLDFKMRGMDKDVFTIRNGKTHLEENRPVIKKALLETATLKILESIKNDLGHLEGKTICLPKEIDYGLPVSRKQSLGHLPFGTKISTDKLEISSGVYWRNEWGARDIDLSSITLTGERTGWGSTFGYSRGDSGIQFSGDIVNAHDGAMEFLTSSDKSYGLFANIFSGEVGAKVEILVGDRQNATWIEKTYIREEVQLKSQGNLLGFVQDKTFTVFYGRLGSGHVSNPRDAVLFQKGLSMNWTVKKLLDKFGISYTNERNADYDLSYEGFTFDKLEKLFGL